MTEATGLGCFFVHGVPDAPDAVGCRQSMTHGVMEGVYVEIEITTRYQQHVLMNDSPRPPLTFLCIMAIEFPDSRSRKLRSGRGLKGS